tara:strand:- start:1303 stop:1632 length:330 start_codon:yes stop_codon:yes gene_type:complete
MIHLSRYQLIILLFVVFINLTGCESEAEKEARYQKEKDACLAREESRCNSACESDPVFTACSLTAERGGNSLSTCRHMYKRESREKQISNCKFEACAMAPFEEVEYCYR